MSNFTEINELACLLEEANIEYEMHPKFGGYRIVIYKNGSTLADAIYFDGSYGYEQGLLEIMGGLTAEENEIDSVLGYLTAAEVFRRFKYCYENDTTVYIKENE